jgi:sugar phosphate isomerase/epimerase
LNLSLSTGSLYTYPLRAVLRMARQAGFDGVEIGVNPEVVARGGQAVRRLVEAEGLALFSVHPTLLPIPGWREKHGGFGRTIELAQAAGAGVLVLHVPRSTSLEAGRALSVQRDIERWQALLAGSSLRLAIENKAILSSADWSLALGPLDRLVTFAERYDLGLVLDTTHAGSAGVDILAARRLFDGRLADVHLSDLGGRHRLAVLPPLKSLLEQHRFPGSGRLPLAALLADLAAAGYRGPVTLEVSPIGLRIWWPPAVRRRLACAAAWMRRAAGDV